MLETYSIGVSLQMSSNATSIVDKLIADMERLNSTIKLNSEGFGLLGRELRSLRGAGTGITALIRAMEKLDAARGAGATATGNMDKMAAATKEAGAAAERLNGILRNNAKLAAEATQAMRDAGRVQPSGGAGNGPPRPPREPRDPRAPNTGGGNRSQRFGGHDLMLLGQGAQMVGSPMLHGAESALERGIEVGHLRTQIIADDRVTPAQADHMVNRAYEATASAPGTRVAENLHSLIDLKNVTGSLEEAEAMLPRFARLTALLRVMDKKRGGDGAFAAAKAMEIMGSMIGEHVDASGHTVREIDPKLLQTRLDMLARVSVATNARVGPQDYLGFAKQARVAGMTLSDEFVYEKLPAIMMAMGGQRAGTALMSMAQVFEGGKLTDKSYDALAKIGLAEPSGLQRIRGADGKMKTSHTQPGIYDLELMRHDPLEWMKKAQERMEANGIHGSENQIIALMKASQRSTIAGMFADLLKDMPAIVKEQENIRHTRPDISTHFAEQDPLAKQQQLQAAWDRMLTAFGSAATGDAVKLMDAVTGALNGLSGWAKNHPDTARVITGTAAGLGALAVALGTLSTAIFLFAPALKLLGLAGKAGAGGAVAAADAATGGGALGLASRLSLGAGLAVGGGAAVVGGALVLGGTTDPIEAQRQIEGASRARRVDPMKAPSDGFGVDGRPAIPATPPPVQNIQLHGTVNLDGKVVGTIVGSNIARGATGPSGGTTGFDIRAGTAGGLMGIP